MHRQKRLHPHRIDKFWYQDSGFTAIPKGYRPPRQEINPEEIDRQMEERMHEYFRQNQSA